MLINLRKKKTNILAYSNLMSYFCIKIENKDNHDTESKI